MSTSDVAINDEEKNTSSNTMDLDTPYPAIVVPFHPKVHIFPIGKFKKKQWVMKQLEERGIVYRNVRRQMGKAYAEVIFENEEQFEEAQKKIEGLELQGKPIKMAQLNKKADKEDLKRKRETKEEEKKDEEEEHKDKKAKVEPESLEKRAVKVTAPWNEIPYDEQLSRKLTTLNEILKKITVQAKKSFPKDEAPEWVQKLRFSTPVVDIAQITAAPEEYRVAHRNKFAFSIGPNQDGKSVVGYRVSQFAEGTLIGEPIDPACGIPPAVEKARLAVQAVIQSSPLLPFNHLSKSGFWRTLIIRAFSTEDVVAHLIVSHAGFTERQVQHEISKLKALDCGFTSFFFQRFQGISNQAPEDPAQMELIAGRPEAFETMLGMRFRVSPTAFFQINKGTTELLYGQIRDLVKSSLDNDTIVLDICCGTGTIGLICAPFVKQVIGVELVQSAVEDAMFNAKLNNVTNAEFICNRVENVMHEIVSREEVRTASKVVVILDPPRAGVHVDVLRAVRKCSVVTDLIYVSCDQKALIKDLPILFQKESNKYTGARFRPDQGFAYDMFPNTDHTEAMISLKREPRDEKPKVKKQFKKKKPKNTGGEEDWINEMMD